MAESEFLCVRAASLLISKDAITLKMMHQAVFVDKFFKILFVVQDICLALNSTQAKNTAIALAIILVRTISRANLVLICDIIL